MRQIDKIRDEIIKSLKSEYNVSTESIQVITFPRDPDTVEISYTCLDTSMDAINKTLTHLETEAETLYATEIKVGHMGEISAILSTLPF